MCRFFTILFVLLFCGVSISQEGNISTLLAQAEDVLYSDPQEAVGIAQYVSQKSTDESQLAEAALILARGFYMKGNYNEALKTALEYSNGKSATSIETRIKIDELLSKIFSELKLNELSSLYLKKATPLLDKEIDNNIHHWLEGKILQNDFLQNLEEENQEVTKLYEAKTKFKKITDGEYHSQIGNINIDLAQANLRSFQLDSAHFYITAALKKSKLEKPGNYLEMKSLVEYSNYLFLTTAHNAAIDTLKSALKIAVKFSNITEQISISEAISENYLAINNLEEFNNYRQKITQLANSQGDVESEAVNTTYNFLNISETEKFNSVNSNSRRILFILIGVWVLLLMVGGFLKIRYRSKIKQYQKFISFLEKRNETDTPHSIVEISQSRTLSIPKEAEEQLLKKLKQFEGSQDFIKKETSLSRLALQFETNTKYLSEIINAHKQKNFNNYINELRINYIIDKLKNEPTYLQYKISYLAEESGFSSHSVFATVFKGITGISPTAFISILQNKDEEFVASKNEN